MKIAIDLEGTLTSECGEFLCERPSYIATLFLPKGLRQGARALLHELHQAGHALIVYSTGTLPWWKLFLWCRVTGLPITQVITFEQEKHRVQRQAQRHQKRYSQELKLLGLTHFGSTTTVSWPPCTHQDLILDDDPRAIQVAWRSGVKGVLVTNCDENWTLQIREATNLEKHAEPAAQLSLP